MTSQTQTAELEKESRAIPERFLARQLEWFKGAEGSKKMVHRFIDTETVRREDEARREGTFGPQESSQTMRSTVVRGVNDYLSLIIKVAEQTCDIVKRRFAEEELSILQVRTSIDLENWLVRLMFVIDGNSRRESVFRELLSKVENAVLMTESLVAELKYANKRGDHFEDHAIGHEYPFACDIKSGD